MATPLTIRDNRGFVSTIGAVVEGDPDFHGAVGYCVDGIGSPRTLSVYLFFPAPEPMLKVRVYDDGDDGFMWPRDGVADLRECLPDDDVEFWAAVTDLRRIGRYSGGGGAAPAYVLELVED